MIRIGNFLSRNKNNELNDTEQETFSECDGNEDERSHDNVITEHTTSKFNKNFNMLFGQIKSVQINHSASKMLEQP
ncbi:hypothetical protein BpHYR1_036312 [Brachionus plicatilis]|uniref:Uncharacterized protein n=1 Tax=Brachionus plicatilis TaxID=10195 RepID=A0A3M7SLL2_BRAPC|nr:hypothetical protein BpHYR1_036312 [Brachionus plicatilis]